MCPARKRNCKGDGRGGQQKPSLLHSHNKTWGKPPLNGRSLVWYVDNIGLYLAATNPLICHRCQGNPLSTKSRSDSEAHEEIHHIHWYHVETGGGGGGVLCGVSLYDLVSWVWMHVRIKGNAFLLCENNLDALLRNFPLSFLLQSFGKYHHSPLVGRECEKFKCKVSHQVGGDTFSQGDFKQIIPHHQFYFKLKTLIKI